EDVAVRRVERPLDAPPVAGEDASRHDGGRRGHRARQGRQPGRAHRRDGRDGDPRLAARLSGHRRVRAIFRPVMIDRPLDRHRGAGSRERLDRGAARGIRRQKRSGHRPPPGHSQASPLRNREYSVGPPPGSVLCYTLWRMARPLRLEFEGALYHVTSRGNERSPIFRDDRDRTKFLEILGSIASVSRWAVHAYCLMGNHYHLLLETPRPNLSAGMQRINGRYTQWFNRRHRRAGHLLQGRFKAILVERDPHLLELCRYVVLNPVRAGMAAGAG